MNRSLKAILIIIGALVLFALLVYAKWYLSKSAAKSQDFHIADLPAVKNSIKADSLYAVKEVAYRDSAILIALDNEVKPGMETYFDKKYKLNGYDNISMVYIYPYDSAKPLQSASFDDAVLATGKKMGRFQQEWVSKFIDTLDGSCKPLKKYLKSTLPNPESFKNEETTYQPASIHKMAVVCTFRAKDSLGNNVVHEVTAVVDASGNLLSTEKTK